MHKIKECIDEEIKKIEEEGLNKGNLDVLYTLVDIKKDIGEIEKGEQEMRYGNYGNYGRGGYGRGDYRDGGMNGGSYGRDRDSRGRYRGNYRGEDKIQEMMEHYENYMDGREEYNRGNYNAKEDEMKSLDYMLRSVEDFMSILMSEASSQEEMEMIRKTAKHLGEMM